MLSQLFYKDQYLNKNIPYLFNKVIIEYDLKSANTSLCKEYRLLSDQRIKKIEDMPKEERVRTIGKIMRKDEVFKKGLKDAFVDIRRRFFQANSITDGDILAIKKDAIFCLKECEVTTFGYCTFVPKNSYSSYIKVSDFEIYYTSSTGSILNPYKIDVKGIDDIVLRKHNDFMLSFLAKAFRHFETSTLETQLGFLSRFIDKYKRLELEVGYYREFNQQSIIRLIDRDETYDDDIFIPYEDKQPHIDISYNFFYILLPLIKILL